MWPETLVWIVPRCSESDPNPMDQSADPSPMDQTDKSLDPSPRHEHICMVALHPTTFSPIHCELCRWWLPRSKPSCLWQACFEVLAAVNLGSTVHILGMVGYRVVAMNVGAHSFSNSSRRRKKPKKAISWPRILVTQWGFQDGDFSSGLEAHSEHWLVTAANSVWP